MGAIKKYLPFFVSTLLMCIIIFIIYPHYQYYIDSDGTSYLTIAHRYAIGDYAKAINGYWSPWSCWLTAMLIKAGFAAIPASIIINTIGAVGFIFISQSLFLKFELVKKIQYGFNITLALFLCFAVFWQTFDDLWECFFLLSSLRLLLSDSFVQRPVLWVIIGFTGTFAYFAKAYSFPFFILNTIFCIWFTTKDDNKQLYKISVVILCVLFASSFPWAYMLHNKYGIWTTSTAGSLNLSWYLVGHPYWKEYVKLLIPPVYPDSPYYWEDPWYANAYTPHFWNSFQLFGLQLVRVIYTCYKFIISLLQISIFFPVIVFFAARSIVSKKYSTLFPGKIRMPVISFLLFPLGYFLINFESRYIWYMLPLGMIFGGWVSQNNILKYNAGNNIVMFVYMLSFLIYPAWEMSHLYNEGKEEYNMAQKLNDLNIHGAFTSNSHPRYMARLAYFSGNQYYYNLLSTVNKKQIIDTKHSTGNIDSLVIDMHRNKVKYYFNYIDKPGESSYLQSGLTDTLKKGLRYIGRIKDMDIIEILDDKWHYIDPLK